MRKNILLDIISALLIFLFLYTGVSKLITFTNTHREMAHSPIVQYFPTLAAIVLPTMELLVSALLFMPNYRKFGLYASFVLMLSFTTYVGFMLAFVPHRPCTCGGVLRTMSWPQHLYFNILFTLLAGSGILLLRKTTEQYPAAKYSNQ